MALWTKAKLCDPLGGSKICQEHQADCVSVFSATLVVKNNSVNQCESVSKKFVPICVHSWLIFLRVF
jgi:hypothetical protein